MRKQFLHVRLKACLLALLSCFAAQVCLAKTDSSEYAAIAQEIATSGYALVSVSLTEAYPEQTKILIDSWAQNNADALAAGVLSEEPFAINDNPLAEYAARLNQVLAEAGLYGETSSFADGIVTVVEDMAALMSLVSHEDIHVARVELYDIDLTNMNATQEIPQVWPTNYGTAPNSIIGIIDTGVEKTHELLAGKVVSEACFSSSIPLYVDSLCPSSVSSLVANNAGLPCADVVTCYHGTNMAGIAAARNKEGAGANYSGVAKGARIALAMVFSTYKTDRYCGKGRETCAKSSDVDVRAALNYMYTVQALFKLIHPSLRLNAVNVSLSGDVVVADYCEKHLSKQMVSYLSNAGVPVVASAGNNGASGINVGVGCNKETVTVGAVDVYGKTILDSSNRDPRIDLYAIGDKINAPTIGNTYRDDKGGTSAAAAAVSGALAILKEKHPGLSVPQLVQIAQDTGYAFKYRYMNLLDVEGKRLRMCGDYRFNGKAYQCVS